MITRVMAERVPFERNRRRRPTIQVAIYGASIAQYRDGL